MAHPTYTLDQIIHQLTTSWSGGDTNTQSWHAAGSTARLGSGDQITYSLGVAPSFGGAAESAGLTNLSAVQIAGAQLAFQLWDDLVPFSIVQTSSPSADTGTAGNDTASFANATGAVYVDLKSGTAQLLDGPGTIEHLVSIENVTGSSNYQNVLIGDQNDNVLIERLNIRRRSRT
jgi:hypothetical protein